MKPLLTLLVLGLCAVACGAAERVALVIGNGAYTNLTQGMQLTSPAADANDVAGALQKLGYRIIGGNALINARREAMTTAAEQFAAAAKSAEAAVFYFSGHGIQVGEDNYLLPTDTPKLTGLSMLKNRGVLLRDSVMVALEEAGAASKVIILDCCRDNPFSAQLDAAIAQVGKSLRTKSVGEISGYGPGFYLAFATSPGSSALDGNGARNSPFTAALLKTLPGSANKDIDFFFRDVKASLPKDQVSWTNHSLQVSFTLGPGGALASTGGMKAGNGGGSEAVAALEEERKKMEMAKLTLPAAPVPSAAATPSRGNAGKPEVTRDRGAVSGFVKVDGGTLPSTSKLGAVAVGTFYIGKYEVQWGEFQAVRTWAAGHGYDIENVGEGTGSSYPVADVNWYEALKWCNARSEMENKIPVYEKKADGAVYRTGEEVPVVNASANGYRLPSEKEWEWAARGGRKSQSYKYSGSNDIAQVAWYEDNSGKVTHAVGTKAPNELGICDMSGNVLEWCFDSYDSTGSDRVVRGGSWDDFHAFCEVGLRPYFTPNLSLNSYGFRLALSSVP